MRRCAEGRNGVDAGMKLVVAVLLPLGRLDHVGRDCRQRRTEPEFAVSSEGDAQEASVAVEDLTGKGDAVEQRWLGQEYPYKHKEGRSDESHAEETHFDGMLPLQKVDGDLRAPLAYPAAPKETGGCAANGNQWCPEVTIHLLRNRLHFASVTVRCPPSPMDWIFLSYMDSAKIGGTVNSPRAVGLMR